MEKFQELILKVAEAQPNASLTEESKTIVQDRLNKAYSQYNKTPDHPPYASMIERALRVLNEKGGSSVESISKFLEKEYPDLPLAHLALLKLHLEKLRESGEIILTPSKKKYMLSGLNPNGSSSRKSETDRPESEYDQRLSETNRPEIEYDQRLSETNRPEIEYDQRHCGVEGNRPIEKQTTGKGKQRKSNKGKRMEKHQAFGVQIDQLTVNGVNSKEKQVEENQALRSYHGMDCEETMNGTFMPQQSSGPTAKSMLQFSSFASQASKPFGPLQVNPLFRGENGVNGEDKRLQEDQGNRSHHGTGCQEMVYRTFMHQQASGPTAKSNLQFSTFASHASKPSALLSVNPLLRGENGVNSVDKRVQEDQANRSHHGTGCQEMMNGTSMHQQASGPTAKSNLQFSTFPTHASKLSAPLSVNPLLCGENGVNCESTQIEEDQAKRWHRGIDCEETMNATSMHQQASGPTAKSNLQFSSFATHTPKAFGPLSVNPPLRGENGVNGEDKQVEEDQAKRSHHGNDCEETMNGTFMYQQASGPTAKSNLQISTFATHASKPPGRLSVSPLCRGENGVNGQEKQAEEDWVERSRRGMDFEEMMNGTFMHQQASGPTTKSNLQFSTFATHASKLSGSLSVNPLFRGESGVNGQEKQAEEDQVERSQFGIDCEETMNATFMHHQASGPTARSNLQFSNFATHASKPSGPLSVNPLCRRENGVNGQQKQAEEDRVEGSRHGMDFEETMDGSSTHQQASGPTAKSNLQFSSFAAHASNKPFGSLPVNPLFRGENVVHSDPKLLLTGPPSMTAANEKKSTMDVRSRQQVLDPSQNLNANIWTARK